MSNDLERVLEKQARRYKVLRRAYDSTDGKETEGVHLDEIAKQEGLSGEEAQEAWLYLEREGLVQAKRFGPIISMTHRSVVEVEQSIRNPAGTTEHFSPAVIQHFHGAVGAVQNAPYSTANINQNIGSDVAEVLCLIQELRQKMMTLPPQQQQEGIELVDALEVEVQSPQRSNAKIKAFVTALGSVMQDTAANVLAALVAKLLGLS